MKRLLQYVVVNSFSLFATSLIFTGLKIENTLETYIVAGIFLTIGEYILKPVLNLVSLPFNFLTFGLFSSLINIFVLYLITQLYPKIHVTSFQFDGFAVYGYHIPGFYASTIFAYFVISATIYTISKLFLWFFDR